MERILAGAGSYGLQRGLTSRLPDHATPRLPDGGCIYYVILYMT